MATYNPNRIIPPMIQQNGAFQLFNEPLSDKLMNEYVTEGLMIGGTNVLIYKLLGIHEQKDLLPLDGTVIANGEYPEFPASNVFQDDPCEWRSIKKCGKRDPNTYIGYDFGPIKIKDTDINKYAIHTEVKYHVTSVYIQQGELPKNRIIKARVENSENGINWKGIALLTIPNDADAHWLDIKQSYPARFWRIVPIQYVGTEDDLWIIKKLSFSEYTKTHISNIQDDMAFLENRDRSYSIDPIVIKAFYNQVDVMTEFSAMGLNLNNQYNFKMGFNMVVQRLKRPIVIGDIIDVLCEVQYDTNLTPVKKYLEVTDVTWDSGGFTPGWQPTLYSITAQPMIASQETMDLMGDLNNDFFDSIGESFNTTALKSSKKIKAEANTLVPEVGGSFNDAKQIDAETIRKGARFGANYSSSNPYEYFQEDAMPPNGLPYTEGDDYPKNPKNKDYHRLTYSTLEDPIPPRLYRYSSAKQRWIFMEEDKRMRSNSKKPTISNYEDNGVDITKIGR
jgi:hypothetical protein